MVRKSTLNDVPVIARLYREQFREMEKLIPDFIKEGNQNEDFIKNTITDENADILVYEYDGMVIGFILLQLKTRPDFEFIVPGKYCYIMDVIITEKFRGNGYGTALLNSARAWAIERACTFINLDVLSNNPQAIKLYEKLGFIPKAQEMYCKI